MTDPQKLADAAGKLMEIIPDAYDDGVKNTTIQTGKIIERVPRLINALAADFDIWIMNREAKVKAVSQLIDKKLENMADKDIVAPPPHIAVPALQAITYSMDSDELRELYANLLAKSMILDWQEDVHPSFVEIIKQMNPRDASNLSVIKKHTQLPIADVRVMPPHGKLSISKRRQLFVSNPNYADELLQSSSITLLNNLGLVDISYASTLIHKNAYNCFLDTESYKKAAEQADEMNGWTIEQIEDYFEIKLEGTHRFFHGPGQWTPNLLRGIVELTSLGIHFTAICMEV